MIAHVMNAVAHSDLQIRDKGGGGKGGSGHPDPEIRGRGRSQINLIIRACLVNFFSKPPALRHRR